MGAKTFRGGISIIDGNIVMQASATVDGVDVSALATTVGAFGTMASQNANSVAISGGAINGATIGVTTPAAGRFTTVQIDTSLTINHANGIIGAVAELALFNTTVTTLHFGGILTAFNMADDTTESGTYNFVTGATTSGKIKTINIGTGANGGNHNISIGSATGTILIHGASVVINPVLTLTKGTIDSGAGTISLFNMGLNATISMGVLSTTITLGGTTASNQINIANGATVSGQTKTVTIAGSGASGSNTLVYIGVSNGESNITMGSVGAGLVTINHNALINGNLTVKGTLTYIESVNLRVTDAQIELNYIDGTSETDSSADTGGIYLHGETDKSWIWLNSTDAWTSNQHINLSSNTLKYKAANNDLIWWNGSKVAVGTIGTGAWEASVISLTYGGTNAALTAVNGGVVYSTATAMAITAAGTSGQFLKSNGASAPSWSALNLDDLGDIIIDTPNIATKIYIYHNGTNWVNATAATAGLATASALNNYLRLDGGTMTGTLTFNGVGITGATEVSTQKLKLKTNATIEYISVSLSADGVVYEENVNTGSYSFLFIYFIHNAGYTSMRSGQFTMNHDAANAPKYDENFTEDNGTESAIFLRGSMHIGTPNKVRINAIISSGTWTIKGYLLRQ